MQFTSLTSHNSINSLEIVFKENNSEICYNQDKFYGEIKLKAWCV